MLSVLRGRPQIPLGCAAFILFISFAHAVALQGSATAWPIPVEMEASAAELQAELEEIRRHRHEQLSSLLELQAGNPKHPKLVQQATAEVGDEQQMQEVMSYAHFKEQKAQAIAQSRLRLRASTTVKPSMARCDGEGGRLCGFLEKLERFWLRHKVQIVTALAVFVVTILFCFGCYIIGGRDKVKDEGRDPDNLDEVWFKKPASAKAGGS
eukprot:TRINITY_DN78686_c0_g1_i1.p1 TRINITY_DN78686_c0_g1~~TRINITY_DN78686_c0_g1_i1.p1  ORF type:complete len:210 (-),score=53.43 TRINITY_DN78686_c0_g1_i1:186-815(-)